MPFIWAKLNSLSLKCFCSNFAWNGLNSFGEDYQMFASVFHITFMYQWLSATVEGTCTSSDRCTFAIIRDAHNKLSSQVS